MAGPGEGRYGFDARKVTRSILPPGRRGRARLGRRPRRVWRCRSAGGGRQPARQGESGTVQCCVGHAAFARNHGYLVYEPLFAFDAAGTPRPQAVESASVSTDGMTWRFTLRAGQSFQDGSPITARDAVASVERWSKRKASGGTMRARDAEADPFTQQKFGEVVGSGPFRFVHEEWVPGSKTVYRRLQATDWGTVVTRATRGDKPGPGSPGWHMHPTWAPGRAVPGAEGVAAQCHRGGERE